MSKFNATQTNLTVNEAGGQAYNKSPEMELVTLLLTSMVQDQAYRTEQTATNRLVELLKKVDPLFAAKAIVYARTQFGMRSISHIAASHLAPLIAKADWGKRFFDKVIYRVDDLTEIVAYHFDRKQKLSSAMKAGFKQAFNRFDAYHLAKYRGENKTIKLVDVVNLVHPTPTDKNREAMHDLIYGTLSATDTWETKLTQAGQQAENADDLKDLKKDAWKELVLSRKIGYFALLRNLRNIEATGDMEIIDAACRMLTDVALIKKSLVLPFRYATAYKEMLGCNRIIAMALNHALEMSLSNVPLFDGKTLVAFDRSGSMRGKPTEVGSLFAAVLYKANNADLIVFAGSAQFISPNPVDSVMTIARSMESCGGGTNMNSVFQLIEQYKKRYDRIILISDNENWIGFQAANASYNSYKRALAVQPFVYSMDMSGYSTMQFPEKNVFIIGGFSDKIFDVMSLLEQDKDALINTIKAVEL